MLLPGPLGTDKPGDDLSTEGPAGHNNENNDFHFPEQ